MERRRYRLKRGQKHYMRGTGRGTNLFRGGDVIELYPSQAHAIRDKLIELGTNRPPEPEAAPEETAAKPHLRHRGGGRYDVIHPETKKPINKVPLSRKDAEALADGTAEAEPDDEKPDGDTG